MSTKPKPASVLMQEGSRTIRFTKSNESPEAARRDLRHTAEWLRQKARELDRWADEDERCEQEGQAPA